MIADSPQRAVLLNCKHPNRTTKHPCPYCKVTQSGEDGGDLGDPAFDIVRKCRTRGHYDRALERLGNLAEGSSQQTKLSRELGVVPRRQALPSPMYELVSAGEVHRRVPPEMLHVDALVRHQLDQCVDVFRKKGVHRATLQKACRDVFMCVEGRHYTNSALQ